MANTKISQLPTWTGTAADSRWFVMNNSGELETFKFQGFTTPIKYMTGTNRIQNVSDATAKVNGNDQTNIGGIDNNIQSTSVRCYILGGYNNTITTKALGYGSTIIGGGGCTIGGSSDATANYGGSIFGSNTAENNAYYSAIIGAYAPSGAFSLIRRGTDGNQSIAGAFIGGGYAGEIGGLGLQSSILGGYSNKVQQANSSIIGGHNNQILDSGSDYNSAYKNSVIVGGQSNTITQKNNVAMIGCSGRTATATATTYVENIHAYRTPSTQVQPVSSGTTFTCNLDNGGKSQFYITGTNTINITNVRDGQSFMIKTQTDGNYVTTWTASGYTFVFAGGIKDPGNNVTDIFVFEVFGSVIYGNRRHNYS